MAFHIVLLSCLVCSVVYGVKLTWINGIAYSRRTAELERKEISRLFGGERVEFCYNPTSMAHDDDMMGYLGDLTQAGTQKLGRFTTEVDGLVRHLREALVAVGERGRVVHIAHSQGALITSLAAKKLSREEMERIEVLAFGGAAALRKTPETPFHRCINYYSINDPLLFVVPSAEAALRSGFVRDEDEFCFLSPRVGDPIQDHYLLSPTYAQALQWEGRRFQLQYHSPLYRSTRKVLLVLAFLAEFVHRRLIAMLRILWRPVLLACQKNYRWTCGLLRTIERPVVLSVVFIVEWVRAMMRKWKGDDNYVPLSKILEQQEAAAEIFQH